MGVIEIVRQHLNVERDDCPEGVESHMKESFTRIRDLMLILDDAIDEGEFDIVISSAADLKLELVRIGLEELSMVSKNIETAAGSTTPFHLSCYFMRLRRELGEIMDYIG